MAQTGVKEYFISVSLSKLSTAWLGTESFPHSAFVQNGSTQQTPTKPNPQSVLCFAGSSESTLGLTLRRLLNPCNTQLWAPVTPQAPCVRVQLCRGLGKQEEDVEVAMATVSSPSCTALPTRLFSITGDTWPPFLPSHQCSSGFCAGIFPFWTLCFCRISYSHGVEAQSTEHIPGLLSIPSLDRAQQETVPARGRKQRSEMWSCKSASSGYFWGQLCLQHCSADR